MVGRQPYGLPLAPAGASLHIKTSGGGAGPLPLSGSSSPKRRWWRVLFNTGWPLLLIMRKRELGRSSNDWVLYAYIIKAAGGETSLEEIKAKLSGWKRRNANSRRISQIMARNKSKGFAKVGETRTRVRGYDIFTSIWSFNGELPTSIKEQSNHGMKSYPPKG